MKISFTIPGRLDGLNEIIGQARYNRFAGASQKKKMGNLCRFWINAARLPKFTGPVKIHFEWHEPNSRRDPDNIRAGSKFILDSLVDAQVLVSDGQKTIKGLSDSFHVSDSKNAHIVCQIEDCDGILK